MGIRKWGSSRTRRHLLYPCHEANIINVSMAYLSYLHTKGDVVPMTPKLTARLPITTGQSSTDNGARSPSLRRSIYKKWDRARQSEVLKGLETPTQLSGFSVSDDALI